MISTHDEYQRWVKNIFLIFFASSLNVWSHILYYTNRHSFFRSSSNLIPVRDQALFRPALLYQWWLKDIPFLSSCQTQFENSAVFPLLHILFGTGSQQRY